MSNEGISSRGVVLQGAGFIVSPGEAEALGIGAVEGLDRHILHYRNGRDLAQRPRGAMVIDLYPLQSEEVRELYPAVFQHVLTSVKPGRDQSRRAATRNNWWLSVRPERISETLPRSCPGSSPTVHTAKHRFFQFLDAAIVPDSALVNVGVTDAGVLSVCRHVCMWSGPSRGRRLGVGNDSRYTKTRTFDAFPFPQIISD